MLRRPLRVVLAYSLWFASSALSLWVMLQLRVFLLIDVSISLIRGNPWLQRGIDRFGTVIFGLVWLIFAVASESYFRRLIDDELSAMDVAKVFGIELLLLAIAVVGQRVV